MISGEVVGQRPMSQRKDAMMQVAKLSDGVDDLIVRPLCAKLMPPTTPELKGWINRDELLDINGRTRARQMQLVSSLGLKDIEPPAGGCLLTEIQFSNKLRDFSKFDNMQTDDIDTLKAGRHLRLDDGAKLIIGRNMEDNQKLEKTTSDKYLRAIVLDTTGPFCLFSKDASQDDIKLATNIIITYAKTQPNKTYTVDFTIFQTKGQKFKSKNDIQKYLIT
jgi:tRNA-specific 2-thiouridylase